MGEKEEPNAENRHYSMRSLCRLLNFETGETVQTEDFLPTPNNGNEGILMFKRYLLCKPKATAAHEMLASV